MCPVNNKIDGVYDLMYCGLLGNPKEKKLNSFVNLVYNELFYYNLFVQYSTETIKSHNDLKLSASNKSLADKDSDRNQWVQEMQTELYFSQEAVKVSISVLRQSFVTYPVHIGFLMYRESLQ
ncbi:hypothetical protein KKG31_07735 [Patescibacteria group bacterium]|nr:hypothetical protein [Patescibacteria group bacterium]MBU1758956.1 hypothetical protein [Patescibacteria group bacterium]